MTLSNKSLAPTPAMERILCKAIYPFHFLTLEQVTRLLYAPTSKNGVGRLLLKLTESGYLDRFTLPTGFALQPYIYMLGRRGKKYFAEEKGWDVPKLPSLSVMQTRSNSFLMHVLEVNTVIIAARLLHKDNPAVQLLRFEHDIALKKQPLIATSPTGKKIAVVPDAIVEIQTGERRVLWIELERGTNKDSDILAKMQDIYDIFDRRVFQERVQTNRCRVCYLTTAGAADMERLRRIARRVLHERLGDDAGNSKRNLIFNFITIPPMGGGELDASPFFLQSSWVNPFGTALSPIIQ